MAGINGNPMNNDWLQQLAPAHAPAPIGWWPLAAGWWGIIGLILIVLIAVAAYLLYQRRRPVRRLRLLALAELTRIENSKDDAELARELALLLRRYALSQFSRSEVAPLSGNAWLDFVVQHGGSALHGDSGVQLLRAAYGGQFIAQREAWLAGARGFMEASR